MPELKSSEKSFAVSEEKHIHHVSRTTHLCNILEEGLQGAETPPLVYFCADVQEFLSSHGLDYIVVVQPTIFACVGQVTVRWSEVCMKPFLCQITV